MRHVEAAQREKRIEGITSAKQPIKEVWQHKMCECVRVSFWRGDTEMETIIPLRERPSSV